MNEFDIILADPPWAYANRHTGGSMKSAANQIYDVMTKEEIAALPVADVMAKNSICCLWTTNPMLQEGLHVLKSWGFLYKTTWPWLKIGRLGMGWWGRVDVEFLLVGLRGRVPPPRFGSTRSTLAAPVGTHSEKPEAMRQRIEETAARSFGRPFVDLNAVELFARRAAPGWVSVGSQLGQSAQAFLAEQKSVGCLF